MSYGSYEQSRYSGYHHNSQCTQPRKKRWLKKSKTKAVRLANKRVVLLAKNGGDDSKVNINPRSGWYD